MEMAEMGQRDLPRHQLPYGVLLRAGNTLPPRTRLYKRPRGGRGAEEFRGSAKSGF